MRPIAPRWPRHAALLRLLACLVLVGLLGMRGAQAASDRVRITDASGHATLFDAPPARVVSLLPSLTETICALGACERLVGVDRYSDWPASVQSLPELGGGLDPNVEAVLALAPDVVFMGNAPRANARLRALGVPVVVLQPQTWADVGHAARQIGRVLRLPAAVALMDRVDREVARVAHAMPTAAQGMRVYFEVAPGPYAAGPASFMGELLDKLGLLNIIDPALGPFPKINPELVVHAAPDLILLGAGSAAALARRPGWSRLRAVQEGHVCVFDGAERDVLVRPGPRMAEAARILARCVTRVLVP